MKIRRVNIIVGKTGSGKSYFVKKNINELLKTNNIIIFDVLNEYFNSNAKIITDYYSFLVTLKENKKKIFFIVKTSNIEEINKITSFIFKYLSNLLLIFEETQIYLNQSIYDFVNYGRHKNIRLILIARRGTELKTHILALVEKVFIFKTTSDYDLIYYSRMFGINKQEIERVKNFEVGEYIEIDI